MTLHSVANALSWLLIFGVIFDLAFTIFSMSGRHLDWFAAWRQVFPLAYSLICFINATDYYHRDKPWMAIWMAGWGTLSLYLWWHNDNNRRKRRKLRDKLAARVASVAGRLKVVSPQPTGS